MKACPDVGANFDAQKFVAEVKSSGVDFLTFHAAATKARQNGTAIKIKNNAKLKILSL
jgi:hypothetical protein